MVLEKWNYDLINFVENTILRTGYVTVAKKSTVKETKEIALKKAQFKCYGKFCFSVGTIVKVKRSVK